MRTWLLVLALALAPALHAATFSGTVSHVTDGDTVWVRPARGGPPLELRLLGIDAPEGCQAHGPQAKAALRQRVWREPVRVRTRGTDDFGRHLATVRHRGQDIGAWLVRNGHAWSPTYRGQPGPYAALQAKARTQRLGLWSQPGALEPRSFRRRFGRCR
jgi:endonuclease YncB( thermonuclease family)